MISRWWQSLALDLRSLALMRIVFGSILLIDLLIRWRWAGALYTDWGCMPRAAVTDLSWNPNYFSLYMSVGNIGWVGLLFLLQGLAYISLIAGYRTRLAGWIAWLLLISLQNRNEMVLDGGDLYFRCLLFWLNFTPWGGRWSLDARTRPTPAETKTHWDLGAIGYVWQLSLIYGFCYLLKTGPEWRILGSAAHNALMVDFLTTPLAPWLRSHPDLVRLLGFGVLYFEAAVPFLLWIHPWTRLLAIVGITSLHLGLGLFLHLGVFALVAATCSWGLIPSFVWDRFGKASPPQAGATGTLKWPVQILLLYLILRVTQWNLWIMKGYSAAPNPADLQILRLDQKWNMFAPRPLTEDGYFVFVGETREGKWVDPWIVGDGQVRWQKPQHVASTFPDARWRKLLTNLADPVQEAWRPYLLEYLSNRWEKRNPQQPLRCLRMYFVVEELNPDGTEKELQVRLLAYHGGRAVRSWQKAPPQATLESGLELLQSLQGAQPAHNKAP